MTSQGYVRDGKVIPVSPLPEGAAVEIKIIAGPGEMIPAEREEFEGWSLASGEALAKFEGEEISPEEDPLQDPDLMAELADWQALAAQSLDNFEKMLDADDSEKSGQTSENASHG